MPLCIKAFKEYIEPLIKCSISDEEIIATFGPSEEGTIMALAPEFYEKGVEAYLEHYERYLEMCPAPFEGIVDILKLLKEKDVRMAMVTGKEKYSTDITLKKFFVDKYFEIIETGIVSGPSKPQNIVEKNVNFRNKIVLKHQKNKDNIFVGIIEKTDRFDLTTCNPPFHSSLEEAIKANERKVKNLGKDNKNIKKGFNFGGQKAELWCQGGELLFLKKMIKESVKFSS